MSQVDRNPTNEPTQLGSVSPIHPAIPSDSEVWCFEFSKMFSSSHTEPQEVWLDVQGIMVCFSLYLPSCKLVCSLPTFGTSFFDKPPTKQWQVRQVSFYYQSKHCTIIGEILQHHHTFALFDLPQRSPPWPLSWVLTFNKQLGVLTKSPPQPPHHNVFEAPDLRVLSRHQWWVQLVLPR